jgi:hypothetical protein
MVKSDIKGSMEKEKINAMKYLIKYIKIKHIWILMNMVSFLLDSHKFL